MPRKTDGMPFELYTRPTNGEDGKPLLYVRPAAPYKRTMRDVETYCGFRGVNRGMVDIAFETFIEACSGWLAEGYRVETPLGTFAPKIKLEGEFTDPSQVKGKDVKFAGLELIPSKRFVKAVSFKQKGFRKKESPVGNSQLYDETFMADALRRALTPGFTTIKFFMAFSRLKYHSAQRYLDGLCSGEHPVLRKEKIGGSYHYFPVPK
ncbi:MAG: hypothetical protein IK023_00450 [Bacteroidaceae bacterium]|nr:hypothetical protein [Bacteroidaceae bacterium]